MSDRTFEDRVKDAEYKAMVEAYRQRHKHDAEREPEPEPETELQRFARAAGAPAPGFMIGRERQYSRDEQIVRKLLGMED